MTSSSWWGDYHRESHVRPERRVVRIVDGSGSDERFLPDAAQLREVEDPMRRHPLVLLRALSKEGAIGWSGGEDTVGDAPVEWLNIHSSAGLTSLAVGPEGQLVASRHIGRGPDRRFATLIHRITAFEEHQGVQLPVAWETDCEAQLTVGGRWTSVRLTPGAGGTAAVEAGALAVRVGSWTRTRSGAQPPRGPLRIFLVGGRTEISLSPGDRGSRTPQTTTSDMKPTLIPALALALPAVAFANRTPSSSGVRAPISPAARPSPASHTCAQMIWPTGRHRAHGRPGPGLGRCAESRTARSCSPRAIPLPGPRRPSRTCATLT